MNAKVCLFSYLILVNLYTWILFGIDKWKALNGQWRIPEKVLFFTSLAGGSLGALVGMKMFHHKTKKKRFSIGIPVFLVIHVGLVAGLLWYRIV